MFSQQIMDFLGLDVSAIVFFVAALFLELLLKRKGWLPWLFPAVSGAAFAVLALLDYTGVMTVHVRTMQICGGVMLGALYCWCFYQPKKSAKKS